TTAFPWFGIRSVPHPTLCDLARPRWCSATTRRRRSARFPTTRRPLSRKACARAVQRFLIPNAVGCPCAGAVQDFEQRYKRLTGEFLESVESAVVALAVKDASMKSRVWR